MRRFHDHADDRLKRVLAPDAAPQLELGLPADASNEWRTSGATEERCVLVDALLQLHERNVGRSARRDGESAPREEVLQVVGARGERAVPASRPCHILRPSAFTPARTRAPKLRCSWGEPTGGLGARAVRDCFGTGHRLRCRGAAFAAYESNACKTCILLLRPFLLVVAMPSSGRARRQRSPSVRWQSWRPCSSRQPVSCERFAKSEARFSGCLRRRSCRSRSWAWASRRSAEVCSFFSCR